MTSSYAVRLRAIFLALVTLVITSTSLMAQWSNLPALPSPRSWVQQTVLNNKLYVFGGTISSAVTAAEAWVLDLNDVDAGWADLTPMPESRYGGFAGVRNGKIYIVAGGAREGTTIAGRSSVLEYDPATDSYSIKADMPSPSWLGGYAQLGDKIYAVAGSVIVGTSLSGLDDTQIYDIAANSWSSGSNTAGKYVQGNAAVIGGDLYYFGGLAIGTSGASMQPQTFKLTGGTGSWAAVSGGNLQTQVYSSAAGSVGGKMYIAGGFNNQNAAVANVQVFDPATNKWTAFFPLAEPSGNTAALSSDGTALYLAGGSANKVQKLTIGAAKPVASVTPSTIYAATEVGGSTSKVFKLSNVGVSTLTGTMSVSGSSPWLTISSSSLSIAAGNSRQYQITANASGLTVGVHTGTITIASNDPDKPSIAVTVNLHVLTSIVQQPIRAVFEEATGAWCGPCGSYGTPEAQRLSGIYEDRLIEIAYHDRGGRSASADLMATTEVESLNGKFGTGFFPSAAIQRIDWTADPGIMEGTSTWATRVETVLSQSFAPAAIEVMEYAYAAATKRVTAKIKITTADVLAITNGQLRLTGVFLEDSLLYPQYLATGGYTTEPYYHMHVARSFWPNIHGQAITLPAEATAENGTVALPGKEFIVDVAFTVKGVTKPANGNVVWILHTGDETDPGIVLQGEEIRLTASVGGGSGTEGVVTVTPDVATKNVEVGQTAVFSTSVKNVTDAPITVTVDRVTNTLPSGAWNSQLCLGETCEATGVNQVSTTVSPNQTVVFKVKVLGGSPNAQGVVGIRIATSGASRDTVLSQTYTVNSGDDVGGVGTETGLTDALSVMAYPNPIAGPARFEFAVPTTGAVKLNLFSTSGEKVLPIFDGARSAGRHSVSVDLSTIPAGVYTLVLSSGGRTTARSITIVH